MIPMRFASALAVVSLLFAGCAGKTATSADAHAANAGQAKQAAALVPVPADKDHDLSITYADGHVVYGPEAMAKMKDAKLVMWLAGNQFFAMPDVFKALQKAHPEIDSIGLITLPPGLILKAIQAGGWAYQGKEYRMTPDIYASVNLGHLQTLAKGGKMDQYMIYLHNRLEMEVAQGNPKHVKGIQDLMRPDLRVMLPNPLTEGIMTFYIKKVLVRHGIWDAISGGKECKSCRPTPRVYFTAVHHREIPDGLKAGTTDVGVAWASEIAHAKAGGLPIDGVVLPDEDSLINEVAYVIGALKNAPHARTAQTYLDFLKTSAAKHAYSKHGFIPAKADEEVVRPIPPAAAK